MGNTQLIVVRGPAPSDRYTEGEYEELEWSSKPQSSTVNDPSPKEPGKTSHRIKAHSNGFALSPQRGVAEHTRESEATRPTSGSVPVEPVRLLNNKGKTVVESDAEAPLVQSFYPPNNDRPRPFLSFAQFNNDPELLKTVHDLQVPILKDAVWRPNSDGWLGGGFSCVEKATWNQQIVAVKFLRSSHSVSGTIRGKKSFRKELAAWRELEHPNILPFLGVVIVDNTYLGMVSPYMHSGSAPGYIAANPTADVLQILLDVATGMSYLAEQRPPIAHGDLKGANVLIDQNGRGLICDFGLSRFMKDFTSIDTTFGGTIRWMAPEQLRAETMTVSLAADVFSWGMLTLELMTGSVPWSEVRQDSAVVIKVAVHRQRPSRPVCRSEPCRVQAHCTCVIGDDTLWMLVQLCWSDNPSERPSALQLCESLKQNPGSHSFIDQQGTALPRLGRVRVLPRLLRKLACVLRAVFRILEK